MMHRWLILLLVLSVFVFLMAHGISVGVAFTAYLSQLLS